MAKAVDPTAPDQLGSNAHAFTLLDQNGEKHKLSDFKGKNVVLFFYLKDVTPSFGLTHKLRNAA